jgi:hypothetical protein
MSGGGYGGVRLNSTADTNVSLHDDSDEQHEVIQVQILPQVKTEASEGSFLTGGQADTLRLRNKHYIYYFSRSHKKTFCPQRPFL